MAIFQNNLLAGAGAQSSDSTHTIDQSIRFNYPDDGNMYRAVGSGGNTKTWTFSGWFKLGLLGSQRSYSPFIWSGYQNDSYRLQLMLDNAVGTGAAGDFLCLYSSTSGNIFQTTRVFRDPSAWYHIVVVSDTSNAVASERIRLYINGIRETSFSTINYPSLNADLAWNKDGSTWYLGKYHGGSGSGTYNYDGYMAELVNLDGTATDCNSFGEFNSSGIWVPKDVSSLSFGTKGWYIDGRDSADLGDDESGQGNDFTTSGLAAHDQVSDSPTNNFCVFSPIDKSYNSIAEGNLKTIGGTNNVGGRGTMGFKSGKWYWEMYINVYADGYPGSGVVYPTYVYGGNDYAGGATDEGAGANHGGATWFVQSASGTTYGSAAANGDVLMYALDRDNNKIYWGVNGTWRNSGNPAGGTGFVASNLSHYDDGTWMPYVCQGSNAGASSSTFNFGQDGTFAGNVTAGGNSDGNGIGNFKYSVPSGFLALCTKNLGS